MLGISATAMRKRRVRRRSELSGTLRSERLVEIDHGDPIGKIVEFQKHNLDPYYGLGGRDDILLTARRPNKFGYVFIVVAAMVELVVLLDVIRGTGPWYEVPFMTSVSLLFFLVGFKLIGNPSKHNSKKTRKEKSRRQLPGWFGKS